VLHPVYPSCFLVYPALFSIPAGRSLAFDTTYFIEYFALDLIMDEKTGA
jgi:hypothetical protein